MAVHSGSGNIVVQGEAGTQRTQCLPSGRQILLCFRPTVLLTDLTAGKQSLGMLEACSLPFRNCEASYFNKARMPSMRTRSTCGAVFDELG